MEFLNFHHLRYFWLVAREGSLTKASQRHNISPPTISAQIAALEESLGEQLFRREGKRLVLTDAGRQAYEMAEEIFSLGQELVSQVRQHGGERPLRFHLGITDSVPKLAGWEMIAPIFKLERPVQLVCREGRPEELLAMMVSGRIELVISDEPAPSSTPLRVFSHPLGEFGTVFLSTPDLVKRLPKKFPACLRDAPLLLPTSSTAWRQRLDAWFDSVQIVPNCVAEFDDAALMKVAAESGLGVAPVPSIAEKHAQENHRLVRIGEAADCKVAYYAITAQRRATHPAVEAVLRANLSKQRR